MKDKIEDIVDKQLEKFSSRDYSKEEYKSALIAMCNRVSEFAIQCNISFFYKQGRKKDVANKMKDEAIVLGVVAAADDLNAASASEFKDVYRKYKYHYKEIK